MRLSTAKECIGRVTSETNDNSMNEVTVQSTQIAQSSNVEKKLRCMESII
jgi:hypothetical protein